MPHYTVTIFGPLAYSQALFEVCFLHLLAGRGQSGSPLAALDA